MDIILCRGKRDWKFSVEVQHAGRTHAFVCICTSCVNHLLAANHISTMQGFSPREWNWVARDSRMVLEKLLKIEKQTLT